MGRYVEEILQPDEKLLYSTTIHWIVYLPGLAGLVVALAAFLGAANVDNNFGKLSLMALAIFAALYGIIGVVRAWFRRWTTEFDVTDKRVIHKTGFIEHIWRTELSSANLSRADLSGADLSYSLLAFTNLRDANLSGARFNKADLSRADLSGADLSGADFTEADLDGTVLRGARGLDTARGLQSARNWDRTIR